MRQNEDAVKIHGRITTAVETIKPEIDIGALGIAKNSR